MRGLSHTPHESKSFHSKIEAINQSFELDVCLVLFHHENEHELNTKYDFNLDRIKYI
jgi:hypothetical protein